jgi:hypothetical protein
MKMEGKYYICCITAQKLAAAKLMPAPAPVR